MMINDDLLNVIQLTAESCMYIQDLLVGPGTVLGYVKGFPQPFCTLRLYMYLWRCSSIL